MIDALTYILASRSPRRRELLGLLIPAAQIVILPPQDSTEPGFDGLRDRPAIERRLTEIARIKADDVARQLANLPRSGNSTGRTAIIAADTTIVATDKSGKLHVLGQPPDDETWSDVVKFWFREYYAGRTHQALTALGVRTSEGQTAQRIVSTDVTFIADVDRRLEWYLSTGEPRGKAGGYGIQGLASLFVKEVRGSLSNVIGLPLEALLELFEELQIDPGS